MNSYQSYRDQALANPEIKKEYDVLEPEFAIIDALLSMRETSGLTQKEVAAKMGTKESQYLMGRNLSDSYPSRTATCGCDFPAVSSSNIIMSSESR